ncbi:hypothetical protein EVAR_85308_1 [Eumeta japonica]|uniref:Uncharacterized protein n=1 Tax=Eumeta variegata TaxID=151549 RepID=A0A4C1V6W9_EUMVA|nr:hypothetical protein EVAR_85308_1 [Eumeta japonica]
MLSRREKLLVHPWEERRFKDHRSKVISALPIIDASPPPERPHVALKLKKQQREDERRVRLENENFALLQRLGAIMKTKRLDNSWTTPMPQ